MYYQRGEQPIQTFTELWSPTIRDYESSRISLGPILFFEDEISTSQRSFETES